MSRLFFATAAMLSWFCLLNHGRSDEQAPPPPIPKINPRIPPGDAPKGMVWIPGGSFWMGNEDFFDAVPVQLVYVDGFWMDKTEVTCKHYQVGARGKCEPTSANNATGFRCVRDP